MNKKMTYVAAIVMTIAATALASKAFAEESKNQKPLQVTGQSRSLNMMLVLRNEKDKIQFVPVRKDFKDKIQETKNY